jgi:hypothetical protein
MLLTRFVPFAALSYAQTAPSPAGTALQVKLMLERQLRCRGKKITAEKLNYYILVVQHKKVILLNIGEKYQSVYKEAVVVSPAGEDFGFTPRKNKFRKFT